MKLEERVDRMSGGSEFNNTNFNFNFAEIKEFTSQYYLITADIAISYMTILPFIAILTYMC